jgi:hypothetical protein
MAIPNYAEGDWFGVALRGGGFGVGLLARKSAGGVLLGYFFGPRRAVLPDLKDLVGLSAGDAVTSSARTKQSKVPLTTCLARAQPS